MVILLCNGRAILWLENAGDLQWVVLVILLCKHWNPFAKERKCLFYLISNPWLSWLWSFFLRTIDTSYFYFSISCLSGYQSMMDKGCFLHWPSSKTRGEASFVIFRIFSCSVTLSHTALRSLTPCFHPTEAKKILARIASETRIQLNGDGHSTGWKKFSMLKTVYCILKIPVCKYV